MSDGMVEKAMQRSMAHAMRGLGIDVDVRVEQGTVSLVRRGIPLPTIRSRVVAETAEAWHHIASLVECGMHVDVRTAVMCRAAEDVPYMRVSMYHAPHRAGLRIR